jgi:hypothetical protein
VTEILTEPVSAPNVWRGDELADGSRWIIRFEEEDFADFERALAHVAKRDLKDVTGIRAEDFPLPHFRGRIDDIVDRLERGLGLVLLRGLPIYDRFSVDEVSCFRYFDSLPKRPGVALGMQLQTGDLQFVNNFVTVHTRTAFVDDTGDPAHQRHLLRLWISRPEAGRPLCPEYAVWRSGYPT